MRRLLQKKAGLLSVLLVMLLAAWLYWPTHHLPLIYDTLLHIRIAGGLTLGSVWLPTEAFGFYRPMTFFPMLLIQQIFDGYPAWLLHANNMAQHMVNAGLLAWLSWRLWLDWRRAIAAGAIFATFPFSYQAVAVYGHNVHPAIVGLVLLGLHSYLTAVSLQSSIKTRYRFTQINTDQENQGNLRLISSNSPRTWWALTAVLFGLMLLTHETAVLFGGFALLVQLNAQPSLLKQPRLLLRQPWLWFLLAGLAYLVVYQFLPISRAPQAATSGRDLWLNGLYLLQAAVFPLAWFAHFFPTVSGAVVLLIGSGLVIGATLWLAWQRPAWREPLLLAWGWWAAASILLGLTLPTDYLLHGPRLLYLGCVGVALLWAHLLAAGWHENNQGRNWLGSMVWTAVLLFILTTSGHFVRTKLSEYAQLTQVVPVMQRALLAGPDPDNAEIVLVNLPQWLDVLPNTYATGVEFVAMLGDYLFAEELVAANLPGEHKAWAVSVPELQTSQAYAYGIQAQDVWPTQFGNRPRHFFITYYLPEGLQTRHTGYLLPGSSLPIASPHPIAQFDQYRLTEATAEACDTIVSVRLGWLPGQATISDTTSIFVQILAEDGRLLTQADGPPLGIRPGLLATSPDDLLMDLREIELADGETAVPHTVLVGVYDFATGVRNPASNGAGQPLPDDAWRIPITQCLKNE